MPIDEAIKILESKGYQIVGGKDGCFRYFKSIAGEIVQADLSSASEFKIYWYTGVSPFYTPTANIAFSTYLHLVGLYIDSFEEQIVKMIEISRQITKSNDKSSSTV